MTSLAVVADEEGSETVVEVHLVAFEVTHHSHAFLLACFALTPLKADIAQDVVPGCQISGGSSRFT